MGGVELGRGGKFVHRLKFAFLGAAALAALASTQVKADVLTVNGGWDTFYFGAASPDPSDYFQDLYGNTEDFQFTLTQKTAFTVVDGWWDGDQFQIFNNGVSLGVTSTPTFDGQNEADHWFAAYKNPAFSSRTWILGPGSYDITGIAVASPIGYGQGAVALGAVPEPATWAMFILGVGMLGFAARRRLSGQAAAA
jgi:hypothetical protein